MDNKYMSASSQQKDRMGLTVQEVIDRLNNIEDKTKHVACPEIGLSFGPTGVNRVEEITVGGYAGAYSFEKTDIVFLGS